MIVSLKRQSCVNALQKIMRTLKMLNAPTRRQNKTDRTSLTDHIRIHVFYSPFAAL